MLRSLLTDPLLAKDENYLFPGGNEPWWLDAPTWEDIESNHPESYILSDIVQGEWYVRTHHLKCKIEKRDVLLPIIFGADKTHTDVKGHLCLEPVIFTLGIFNRATRNKPSAWRPLGFIPNISMVCSKLEPVDKVDNYHRCLDVILESFVKVQASEGVQWNVKLQGNGYDIVFKPEVCMVVGDNEGQAKMCAMYQSRSSTGIKCLCRHCTVPTDKIHCTYEEVYPLHNQKEINEWIEKFLTGDKYTSKAMQGFLRECSHQAIRNAWCQVSFGWYGIGNINAATTADILHTILLGVLLKLEESILTCRKPNSEAIIAEITKTRQKAISAKAVKKNKKVQKMIQERTKKYNEKMRGQSIEDKCILVQELQEMNDDLRNATHDTVITEAFTEDVMSKFLVFSKKVKIYVEVIAKKWGWLLLHQSD